MVTPSAWTLSTPCEEGPSALRCLGGGEDGEGTYGHDMGGLRIGRERWIGWTGKGLILEKSMEGRG